MQFPERNDHFVQFAARTSHVAECTVCPIKIFIDEYYAIEQANGDGKYSRLDTKTSAMPSAHVNYGDCFFLLINRHMICTVCTVCLAWPRVAEAQQTVQTVQRHPAQFVQFVHV